MNKMSMEPKISVIVPFFNPGTLFDRCIGSLVSQTLADIEMIFVNDCSTDGSREVIGRYAETDSRIIVSDSDSRMGAGKARNKALEMARGDMVAFVDSDDFIDGDFLEKLWARHVETGADIVKGERKRYSAVSGVFSPDSPFCNEMHRKVKTGKGCFVGAFTSAIYSRTLVSEYGVRFLEDVTFFEDAYFPIAAELYNRKTETVDGTYYYYTFNPASVCNTVPMPEQDSDRLKGVDAVMDMMEKAPDISDEHYLRVYEFLFSGVYSICRNRSFSNEGLKESVEGLMGIVSRCRMPADLLCRHFEEQKTLDRRALIDAIRRK